MDDVSASTASIGCLLSTLIEKFDGGPVGLETLAAAVGEDKGTLEDVVEPYLIHEGFLARTPRGRVATRGLASLLRRSPPEKPRRPPRASSSRSPLGPRLATASEARFSGGQMRSTARPRADRVERKLGARSWGRERGDESRSETVGSDWHSCSRVSVDSSPAASACRAGPGRAAPCRPHSSGVAVKGVERQLRRTVARVARPPERPPQSAALAALSGFPLRFVLAPFGLVLLISMLLPGRRGELLMQDPRRSPTRFVGYPRCRSARAKKARKRAAAIAKKGMPLEAGELCFAVGCWMDEAAEYFMKAGEPRARRRDPPRPESLHRVGGALREGAGATTRRASSSPARRVRTLRRGLRGLGQYERRGRDVREGRTIAARGAVLREVRVPAPRRPGLHALRAVGEGRGVPRAGADRRSDRSSRRRRFGARRPSTPSWSG